MPLVVSLSFSPRLSYPLSLEPLPFVQLAAGLSLSERQARDEEKGREEGGIGTGDEELEKEMKVGEFPSVYRLPPRLVLMVDVGFVLPYVSAPYFPLEPICSFYSLIILLTLHTGVTNRHTYSPCNVSAFSSSSNTAFLSDRGFMLLGIKKTSQRARSKGSRGSIT